MPLLKTREATSDTLQLFLLEQMHVDHKLTHFLPCAASPNPILLRCVCHSFQEIRVVLSKAEVVVRAHVDDIVYSPPG